MEKELLLQIQVTKSNLAKALMTRRKDQIEKHRHELEELYSARNALDHKEQEVMEGGSPDDDSFEKSSSAGSEFDYSSDGWTTSDSKESESDEHEEQNKKCKVKSKEKEKGEEVEKKASKTSSKTKREKIQRRPRPCPLKGCNSKVIHLPRHLREVHKWTRERAMKANSRYGLRESFQTTQMKSETRQTKYKDYHRHRPCPIPGCTSVVKRLSMHLQQVHKNIKKGSTKYKDVLKEARSFKTWRPSSHDDTSLARPNEMQDGPEEMVNCTSAAKDEKSKMHWTEEVSDQDSEEYPLAESLVYGVADISELQGNDNENMIMKNAEKDTENVSVESDSNLFSSFCRWLQTADGGRKDQKLSKQHASQLYRILCTIDPNKELNSLFDKDLIRDKFLKEHAEQKYTADTIKAYLLSLRHFCSYIIAEEPNSIKVDSALVHQIEEKARLWTSSYKKDSNRRHLQKMNEDLANLITPEMVTKYERSESARSAVSYIGQLSGAHSLEVNQAIYTLIRDFVLLEITFANAHRSGVLANMTLSEFKKVKRADKSFVISVANHKTADTHGPARVVLPPTLFSYLTVYVNEVRSQVESSSSDKNSDKAVVFLSWSGLKLESGQISTAINAAWRKGGMEGHISSTLFRKSAVTTVHANHKEMRGDLADLMAHKETTAKKFYRLREKQDACLQAATQLTSIMRSSAETQKAQCKSKEASDGTAASPAYNKVTASVSSTERISWKEEDVRAIKDLFAKEILEQSVTMAMVKDRIIGHPSLQHIEPKKVLDRVRSEWRNCGKSNSESQKMADCEPYPNLPTLKEPLSDKMNRFFSTDNRSESMETGSVDMVPPSSSSYTSGKIFSQEERNFLMKVCGTIVRAGVISKPAVKEMLVKEEEGREILRKFTLDQIINRLKYERRLNNRRSKAT
ncbi:uncharacterized protein [Montipora foliosa]|uniref:uncharacterized protein n=1 Tax=Montipora foliosa TaxID=591990 RepID=UPI0035F17C9B